MPFSHSVGGRSVAAPWFPRGVEPASPLPLSPSDSEPSEHAAPSDALEEMPDLSMNELETRFALAARGRDVSVRLEAEDSILALDYSVAFKKEANSFEVLLRNGGCFEGAYRCIERFIEAAAEGLDGVNSVSEGHLDLRSNMQYWIPERIYDQFRSDLEAAVVERTSWLERTRPDKGAMGAVVIGARVRALLGLLTHLQRAHTEVRRAVLSPQTIRLWRDIGLNVFSEVVQRP